MSHRSVICIALDSATGSRSPCVHRRSRPVSDRGWRATAVELHPGPCASMSVVEPREAHMDGTSLFDHLNRQLTRLCTVTGADSATAQRSLRDLLGPAADEPRHRPPGWESGIADDHTPVEFSVAFNRGAPPILRILGEARAATATPRAHLAAGHEFVRVQAARYGLSLIPYATVGDLFESDDPQSNFTLW